MVKAKELAIMTLVCLLGLHSTTCFDDNIANCVNNYIDILKEDGGDHRPILTNLQEDFFNIISNLNDLDGILSCMLKDDHFLTGSTATIKFAEEQSSNIGDLYKEFVGKIVGYDPSDIILEKMDVSDYKSLPFMDYEEKLTLIIATAIKLDNSCKVMITNLKSVNVSSSYLNDALLLSNDAFEMLKKIIKYIKEHFDSGTL